MTIPYLFLVKNTKAKRTRLKNACLTIPHISNVNYGAYIIIVITGSHQFKASTDQRLKLKINVRVADKSKHALKMKSLQC